MGKPNFSVPDGIDEMLLLLNATHLWNLWLRSDADGVKVAGGDQLLFTAHSEVEAHAFIAGCFLSTFVGKNVKQIKRELTEGRFANLYSDDAEAEIDRDRAEYAREMRERGDSSRGGAR